MNRFLTVMNEGPSCIKPVESGGRNEGFKLCLNKSSSWLIVTCSTTHPEPNVTRQPSASPVTPVLGILRNIKNNRKQILVLVQFEWRAMPVTLIRAPA